MGLLSANGGVGPAFHIVDIYAPPTWPSEPYDEIMQMHLEIWSTTMRLAELTLRSASTLNRMVARLTSPARKNV